MMYTLKDLKAAIAVFSNVDLEDPDIDQIDELIINAANKIVAADEILDAHEAGEIELEDAHMAIAELITESAEADLEVFDLEIDLVQVEEEENYSAPTNQNISFSQALGGAISNLIAEEYVSPVEGKKAIADATGLNLNQVNQIITGDLIPETKTAANIAACFSVTCEGQGLKEFMDLSANALNEVARFSNSNEVPIINHKVNKLEAEFNAIAQKQELEDVLRSLNKEADNLISTGQMTPYEKTLLFGKYEDAKDGLALFTAACQANNTPPDVQVDRIRHSLSMASQRNADARFSSGRHDDYILEVPENDADLKFPFVKRLLKSLGD